MVKSQKDFQIMGQSHDLHNLGLYQYRLLLLYSHTGLDNVVHLCFKKKSSPFSNFHFSKEHKNVQHDMNFYCLFSKILKKPSIVQKKMTPHMNGLRFSLKWSKKKFKMADSKKLSFSATPKSWAIVAKISQIGPWVSRIDWCEGHQCDSTYMAVRLSDVSSKKG